ncbi:MAG: dihydroneopterin aldolase [Campylobacterota bacterium]|nr:dihydroneopterin aldolase [Campylobacterota bacterium]
MTIHVENLKFQAIIGILDFERVTPQDIVVNLTIDYDYKNEFINYAELVDIIKSDMIKNKFLLIEDALKQISQKLKKEFLSIKKLNLKISKPTILSDCIVSVSDNYEFNS